MVLRLPHTPLAARVELHEYMARSKSRCSIPPSHRIAPLWLSRQHHNETVLEQTRLIGGMVYATNTAVSSSSESSTLKFSLRRRADVLAHPYSYHCSGQIHRSIENQPLRLYRFSKRVCSIPDISRLESVELYIICEPCITSSLGHCSERELISNATHVVFAKD